MKYSILDKTAEKDESFSVELFDPKGGVKLGRLSKTVVTIINDDDMKNIAARMANMVNADLDAISVVKKGWKQQFQEAMNVNGGDIEEATKMDYIMHFFSFPWKVAFAFLPPPHVWGGWLCFFCSLTVIGILTAVVGDAAAIFGCLVGLKDSVTAIT
jgi:solute carrier family 8 (sodium/calcium exchanger)